MYTLKIALWRFFVFVSFLICVVVLLVLAKFSFVSNSKVNLRHLRIGFKL